MSDLYSGYESHRPLVSVEWTDYLLMLVADQQYHQRDAVSSGN